MKEQILSGNATTESLAALFHRAARVIARASHRHARPHHAQARVYAIIKERGTISQRELLTILDVRSASLSEILAKLERNGLIVKERNPEDKRGFMVSASENSDQAAFLERHRPEKSNRDLLFGALEKEEKEQLAGLLQKIIHAAEQDDSLCPPGEHGRHHDSCRSKGTGRGHGRIRNSPIGRGGKRSHHG